jgi:hypothetical protein
MMAAKKTICSQPALVMGKQLWRLEARANYRTYSQRLAPARDNDNERQYGHVKHGPSDFVVLVRLPGFGETIQFEYRHQSWLSLQDMPSIRLTTDQFATRRS